MSERKEINTGGYIDLANAIIALASRDYVKAARQLKRNPKSRAAMAVTMECEDFFRSDLYDSLTSINGEWLIRRLREEALKS